MTAIFTLQKEKGMFRLGAGSHCGSLSHTHSHRVVSLIKNNTCTVFIFLPLPDIHYPSALSATNNPPLSELCALAAVPARCITEAMVAVTGDELTVWLQVFLGMLTHRHKHTEQQEEHTDRCWPDTRKSFS